MISFHVSKGSLLCRRAINTGLETASFTVSGAVTFLNLSTCVEVALATNIINDAILRDFHVLDLLNSHHWTRTESLDMMPARNDEVILESNYDRDSKSPQKSDGVQHYWVDFLYIN